MMSKYVTCLTKPGKGKGRKGLIESTSLIRTKFLPYYRNETTDKTKTQTSDIVPALHLKFVRLSCVRAIAYVSII